MRHETLEHLIRINRHWGVKFTTQFLAVFTVDVVSAVLNKVHLEPL